MLFRRPPEPNVEECLCAAAHRILTDGMRHSWQAQTWALRVLSRAAGGRPTAFTNREAKRLARH